MIATILLVCTLFALAATAYFPGDEDATDRPPRSRTQDRHRRADRNLNKLDTTLHNRWRKTFARGDTTPRSPQNPLSQLRSWLDSDKIQVASFTTEANAGGLPAIMSESRYPRNNKLRGKRVSFLRSTVKLLLKQAAFSTPLHRSLFNPYSFMHSPMELMFLAQCVSDTQAVPGCFIEAGCAYGATTLWLSKYMEDQGIDRDYYAIDTFSGFKEEHVNYERDHRSKSAQVFYAHFGDNKQAWFDKTMALHGAHRVRSIYGDVSTFDFATLSPIAFCLLDVDLYLPIKASLPKIYQAMSPGGLLIVDDCWRDEKWDGALQAYDEFTAAAGIERRIVGRKLGVISRKPEHG